MKILGLLFLTSLFLNKTSNQRKFYLVNADSKVHFIIKNFGIKANGYFTGIKGDIEFYPANLASSFFNITIDANTIDTDNETRDIHLRASEYFNTNSFPNIKFVSTKLFLSSILGKYYMYGNITIKGITKPIEFTFDALQKNGGYIFNGEFKINRIDFGVGTSSTFLSDKLTVSLSVFAK